MFRFANPEYFYLLALLPVLAAVHYYTFRRARRRYRAYGEPRLLRSLSNGHSRMRPLLKFSLLLAVMALLIVMLARPQYGLAEDTEKKTGIEAAIMIDVSNSMLATDIRPSRLERSKLLVSNLIDRMKDDKIALGVFAGEAYPQLPITNDYVSAKLFLNAITTGMVTLQGTNLGAAIELANNSFTDKKKVGKAIIIITDGEDHEEGAEEAAKAAAKDGRQVFILGVGTGEGSRISAGGQILTDEDGQPVVSRLNEELCREVAAAGNGVYIHIDNTNSAQQQLLAALDKMEKSSDTVSYSSYDEQFQAVGWLVLLLLLVEFFIFEGKNSWFDKWHLFNRNKKNKTLGEKEKSAA